MYGAAFISFCNAHNEKVVQKWSKENIWLRYMLHIYYQLPRLLLLKIMILLHCIRQPLTNMLLPPVGVSCVRQCTGQYWQLSFFYYII